MTWSLLDQ